MDFKKRILAQTEKLIGLITYVKLSDEMIDSLKKVAYAQRQSLVAEIEKEIKDLFSKFKEENLFNDARPSKHEYFMNIAHAVKMRSHDSQTKVGAVLVCNDHNSILGTGYNGFVRGADDSILPTTRPEKYQYMQHAEKNLISNLIKRGGVSTDNSTLYCTLSPCQDCMRFLYQSGITKVIIENKYKDFDSLKKMMDLQIDENQTPEGFIELTYRIKTK